MTKKKPRIVPGKLKVVVHTVLMQTLEEGCGFAINRIEDCGWKYIGKEKDYRLARDEALQKMLNELSNAVYGYFEVEE